MLHPLCLTCFLTNSETLGLKKAQSFLLLIMTYDAVHVHLIHKYNHSDNECTINVYIKLRK